MFPSRVDVFLPNVDQVGGFSMYSSPKFLEETGTIKLAVKKSNWPPASWVHSQCRSGIKINLRVGGDFFYEVPKNSGTIPDMIFIAGGVGINPLLSILQHVTPVLTDCTTASSTRNMTLLYSARTSEEILFQVFFI
jgi:ferredoxin-NADP reductase